MAPGLGKDDGSWSEYAKLVLNQLEATSRSVAEAREEHHNLRSSISADLTRIQLAFQKEVSDLRDEFNAKLGAVNTQIALLQLKSGLWGAASGIGGVLLIWATTHFLKP